MQNERVCSQTGIHFGKNEGEKDRYVNKEGMRFTSKSGTDLEHATLGSCSVGSGGP